MNEFLGMLFGQLFTNHMLQGAVLSVLSAQLRHLNKSWDSNSQDPRVSAIVQALTALAGVLVAIGTAYLNHKLEGLDTASLMAAVLASIQTLVGVFGTHFIGVKTKDALKQ